MNLGAIYDQAALALKAVADTEITVLKAGTKTSLGQTVEDWTSPTTAATLNAVVTAAGKTTLERAGLLGEQNLQSVNMERYDLDIAQHRLRIDGADYEVVRVNVHPSHTSAVVRKL